jgi:hypothetical protein
MLKLRMYTKGWTDKVNNDHHTLVWAIQMGTQISPNKWWRTPLKASTTLACFVGDIIREHYNTCPQDKEPQQRIHFRLGLELMLPILERINIWRMREILRCVFLTNKTKYICLCGANMTTQTLIYTKTFFLFSVANAEPQTSKKH